MHNQWVVKVSNGQSPLILEVSSKFFFSGGGSASCFVLSVAGEPGSAGFSAGQQLPSSPPRSIRRREHRAWMPVPAAFCTVGRCVHAWGLWGASGGVGGTDELHR